MKKLLMLTLAGTLLASTYTTPTKTNVLETTVNSTKLIIGTAALLGLTGGAMYLYDQCEKQINKLVKGSVALAAGVGGFYICNCLADSQIISTIASVLEQGPKFTTCGSRVTLLGALGAAAGTTAVWKLLTKKASKNHTIIIS